LVLFAVFTLGGGCSFGESGVEPPLDRIFLPGGLAIDSGGDWLYAVSSNSDLRFNAGTVVVVNAAKARLDQQRGETDRAAWPACPSPGYVPSGAGPPCCWDFFDDRVLNCDDRAYIDPRSTVRIGSFGSRALFQPAGPQTGGSSRLYVTVRSEPSVTFMELVNTPAGMSLRCDAGTGGANPSCDEDHKIRGDYNNKALSALRLLEEPSVMALDESLGLLYVGHLIEGLSIIDTCTPKPTLVSINRRVFSGPGFGVTSLLLEGPGDPKASVLITGRQLFSGEAGEVQTMSLRGLTGGCGVDGPGPRPVEAIQAEGFFSSAFYPSGTDIRAIVETPDHNTAYLLHRNSFGRSNPPALVEVDRSKDEEGRPRNRAVGVVETCAGATELHLHDPAPGQPGGGPRLYVVCFEAGQVYVIQTAPLAVTGVINVGRGPTTMVFSPNDPARAYVAGFSDNNLSVLNLMPSTPTSLNPSENRVVQRIGFPMLRKK
jgi:hypothetical protein